MSTEHFLQETRNPVTGLLDSKLTANTFGLTMKELGQIVRRDPSGLARNTASRNLQPELLPLEELGVQVRDVFGSLEVGRMWLHAPNPVLAGEAPISYLLRGDLTTIRKLLRMAENGMPT